MQSNESGTRAPAVSVGLPVFNGENYLNEAVDSILAQTFTDFELIISDNASTDCTEEIGRWYAAHDDRVRYHRNDSNIGGARNQKLTVDLSRGRYFRLSAHDDRIAPTFLEECVRVLEDRSDVVIAYPGTIIIDDAGREVSEYVSTRGTAATPSERFAELAFRNHHCDAIYGVVRGEVIRTTPPMDNHIDADKVFLCRLAMRGPFAAVPERLLYKRFHAKNHVTNWRDRMAWYNPDRKGKPSFPNWMELRGFLGVVLGADIGLGERLRCARTTLAWSLRYSPKLAKDLLVAAELAWSALRRKPRAGIYNWE